MRPHVVPFSVRGRDPVDLPACVEVLAAVHRVDGYPLNWPVDPYRWLCPSRFWHAWVAEAGSAGVVGHLAVHRVPSDPDHAEVGRLFVAPDFRRCQVGTALLRQARRWAAARRLTLVLEVVDDRRSPAVARYQRDGWRHTGAEPADWTAPDGSQVILRRYLAD